MFFLYVLYCEIQEPRRDYMPTREQWRRVLLALSMCTLIFMVLFYGWIAGWWLQGIFGLPENPAMY